MLRVSWFWEFLPEQKIIEEKILNIIRNSYKQFWYTSIETPAVEKNSVLTAKWGEESLKQIFWLYGLAQWCEKDTKKYSLHFDLTVPFARYVIDHKNEINFPFKRNQIQKVRRWERAQKWRFREFYQADIDAIWEEKSNKNYLFYDVEIIFVIFNTLKKVFEDLNIKKDFYININHKKLIKWFLKELNLEAIKNKITNIIDKKDKISEQDFIKELRDLNIDEQKKEKIIEFTNIKTFNIEDIKKLNIDNEEWNSWIKDIEEIFNTLEQLWVKNRVKINLSIMRGLDYYTGMVFETFIGWERNLWSIASWWRYENFTSFIDKKTNFSWVGWSIWISRLESYIFEKLGTNKKTSSEYLLINFKETQKKILNLYKKFVKQWEYIEYYPISDKLWKQFKYADKKWIKYCIILWEEELYNWKYKIKNMETWEVIEREI